MSLTSGKLWLAHGLGTQGSPSSCSWGIHWEITCCVKEAAAQCMEMCGPELCNSLEVFFWITLFHTISSKQLIEKVNTSFSLKAYPSVQTFLYSVVFWMINKAWSIDIISQDYFVSLQVFIVLIVMGRGSKNKLCFSTYQRTCFSWTWRGFFMPAI